MGTGDDNPDRISTTERVAQILLEFAADDRWLGVTEVAHRTDLSKAVVHRMLRTLVNTGLLSFDSSRRLYSLGPGALALGRAAVRESDLLTAGMPLLSHLAQETGETVTISARIGHERVYVAQIESSHSIRIKVTVGQRIPLTLGSSGLAMLAFMPERDIDIILESPIAAKTERTLVDPDGVRERLALIRASGWASTAGERLNMSSGTAAPIFDPDGSPVGALSVAYLDSRLIEPEKKESLARSVVSSAALVTEELGRLIHRGASF